MMTRSRIQLLIPNVMMLVVQAIPALAATTTLGGNAAANRITMPRLSMGKAPLGGESTPAGSGPQIHKNRLRTGGPEPKITHNELYTKAILRGSQSVKRAIPY